MVGGNVRGSCLSTAECWGQAGTVEAEGEDDDESDHQDDTDDYVDPPREEDVGWDGLKELPGCEVPELLEDSCHILLTFLTMLDLS